MASGKTDIHRRSTVVVAVLGNDVMQAMIVHAHTTLCKVAKGAQHELVTPCPGTNHLLYVIPPLLRHQEFPELVPMVGNVTHDACADHAMIPVGIR